MSADLEDLLRAFFDEEIDSIPTGTRDPCRNLQPLSANRTTTGDERHIGARRTALSIVGLASACAAAEVAVGLWRVRQASPWRDEGVTLAVTRRSVAQILRLAGHVDAVVTPYYLLVHAVTPASHSLYSVRLVSVVCAALGAACLVWLGALVGGNRGLRVGAWAGVVYIADPMTSRYAQEARPYALAMFLATLCACLLVKSLRTSSRRWLALYVAATIVLAYTHVLALLLLPAHALTVVMAQGRPALRRWTLAWLAGSLTVAPLAIFGFRQRAAMAWHAVPTLVQLQAIIDEFGGDELGFHVLLLALAVGLAFAYERRGGAPTDPGLALRLAAPWLLLPPLLLFVLSQSSPMFSDRYLLVCVPGLCLLAGIGLALMPWPCAICFASLFSYLVVPMQLQIRGPVGHAEDVRGAAAAVAADVQHGDAVIFLPGDRRVVAETYPDDFERTSDVLLRRSAASAGSIAGTELAPASVPAAMLSHDRLIVLSSGSADKTDPVDEMKLAVLAADYRPVDRQQFAGFTVTVYAKSPTTSPTCGLGLSTCPAAQASTWVTAADGR